MIEDPEILRYVSVVLRYSGKIIFTIFTLNDLKVSLCDIQNTYLTAKCQEKTWKKTGIEIDSKQSKIMIIVQALYGLNSSGASFIPYMAEAYYN